MTEKKPNLMSEVAQAQLAVAGSLDRMDQRVNAWLVLLGEDQDHSITAQSAREDMATIRGAFATHNNGTSFGEVLQQLEAQPLVSRMDAWAPASPAPAPGQEPDYAAVLADLQRVCKHHGVALTGSCIWEGIHGEIEIAMASAVVSCPDAPDQLQTFDNAVFVTAIGIQKEAT